MLKVPPEFAGFRHSSGEIWLDKSGSNAVHCVGQDDEASSACLVLMTGANVYLTELLGRRQCAKFQCQ